MCGINIIYHNIKKNIDRGILRRMNHALKHRGPDSHGIYTNEGVGLGHTRLSIVGISSGKQPLSLADGRLTIVYNGELYNYKSLRAKLIHKGYSFTTDSDTEVILNLYQLYGKQCVNHMQGMFSFAIHEPASATLFIARDRLGIKPLFYYWNGKVLVAASEIKAIFASGYVVPQLCKASIKNYFTYQFSISPYTPFSSVFELEPGHHMTLTPDTAPEIYKYWDLEFPQHNEYESIEEKYWLDIFQSGMENAVSSHTIGEVPIGSYLSGGIDSCAITEILKKTGQTSLQTFSIGFEDESHDESPIFKKVAEHIGVENKQLFFSNNDNYLNNFKDSLYHLEQPQRMSVDVPHFLLSKMVQQQNYKVVFTGDGADEILAGYDCFRQDTMRTNSNGLFRQLLRKRHYLKKYTEYFSEDYMRMLLKLHTNTEQQKIISKFGFYPAWYDFWKITESQIDNLFLNSLATDNNHLEQINTLIYKVKPKVRKYHPLNQSLYFETKSRLPGWILWKSDRLSMAHSIEARVPFMDHKLVEITARIPPHLKLNGMNEKYILKRMMESRLPEMPHQYKKRGFYTPIKEWFFTAERQHQIEKYFSFYALLETGIFNPVTVNKMYGQLKSMPAPTNMNTYYQCMKLEWILLAVLSVQILSELFISKEASCFDFTENKEQLTASSHSI